MERLGNLHTPRSGSCLLLGARNSLRASRSVRSRWPDPRLPSRWRRDFDGGLGLRCFRRVACLHSGRRAGLCWALRRFRLRWHLGLAPRRLLHLLGTHGDRALPRGAVLDIYNNVGDGLAAPRCLGPLGGLRPASGLRPLSDLNPPAGSGDYVLLLRHLIEPVGIASPALNLRDRSLRRVGRGDPCLLCLTVVLGGDLPPLRLPRSLRLLVLLGVLLLFVPGPILGPDLLILWDWGQGIPDDPHPLRNKRKKEIEAGTKGKQAQEIKAKNSLLPVKRSSFQGASTPPGSSSYPGVSSSQPERRCPMPISARPTSLSRPRGRPGSSRT